jgi:hypothetical protein
MAILDDHLNELSAALPDSSYERLPSGAVLVIVPNVRINQGWSHESVTIRFLAPVGYPHAKPDCFWSDPNLRLGNQAMPNATNTNNPIPEVPNQPGYLWFSWHVAQWNPNRDTLLTYLNVIKDRFRKAQ